jgi:hypothetical protein
MDFSIVQASNGRRGGVLMMWKSEVQIHKISACPNYIDVHIIEDDNKEWRLTSMYGEFKWADKYKTWDKIKTIHQQNTLPWLILGDLNEILYDYEKEGGRIRPQHFMQAFHDTLDTCGLSDIGYVGDPFTWHRGAMRERLDRGITNASWSQMQSDAALLHLEYNHSDHRVLLLDTEYNKATPINGGKQNKFEAKSFKEEGFTDIVQEKWQASDQGQPTNVLDRQKIMHEGLHEWDRTILQKQKNDYGKPNVSWRS